jgi:hypothetical protein
MFCKTGFKIVGNLQRCSWVHSTLAQRGIASTHVLRDSFKVQDMDDFKDKVLNSEVPVVIDFFAT